MRKKASNRRAEVKVYLTMGERTIDLIDEGFEVAIQPTPAAWLLCCPNTGPVEFAMNAVYPHRHHLSAKMRGFIDLGSTGRSFPFQIQHYANRRWRPFRPIPESPRSVLPR